ncbi:MAG: hypothetical protein WBL39_13960 [Terrimicrobiaceae bacterium]
MAIRCGSGHPTPGVPQSKPRLPETQQNGSPASKEEVAKLNREYLAARNRQMAAKAFMVEAQAARQRGELLKKFDAKVALGFLLTGLRQRLMSFSYALPRRLAGKNEHECGRIIDAEVRAALRDIATWPEKLCKPALVPGDRRRLAPAAGNRRNG